VDTVKQDRAERLFRQQEEAPKALAEYGAKQEATRLLTAKLRVERLAREALKGKPKPDRKRVATAPPLSGLFVPIAPLKTRPPRRP
jgi:hypothetical protein